MQRQEKFGKVHFVLTALTLVFLAALAVLAVRERAGVTGGAYHAAAEETSRAVTGDTYRVEAERAVSEEDAEAAAGYEPLDINTATAEELQGLTGIGPVLAQAIVDYRTEHGPFRSVDELLEVSGIGEGKLGGVRDEIAVNGG